MKKQSKSKAREYYVIIDGENNTWYVSNWKKLCREVLDGTNWREFGCKIIKVREVLPRGRK